MFKLKSLSTILLFSMMGVGLASVIPFSIILYHTMHDAEQEKLIQISNATLKPIINLAVNSVMGANKMKLRNKDAQNLYTSAGLLYIHIEGMSNATPASAFTDAYPPRKVEYEFRRDNQETRFDHLIKQSSPQYLDKKQFVLILTQKLSGIDNGGQITAVFSAEFMKGLSGKILIRLIIPILTVLALITLIAIFLGRWISRPIVDTSQQISKISQSLDLSSRVSFNSDVIEINSIVQAFNGFVGKVEEIIRHLSTMTEQVQDSSMTLSNITRDAQQRTSAQDSEAEKATHSMTELTSVAEQVNANAASQSAQEADKEAKLGLEVVNQTVNSISTLAAGVAEVTQAISRVETDSNNIGGVLDVIRGIAEQTNLLALNAAIEAARAGENGRGFAVVADEVRSLAGRTQESTQEIHAMVEALHTGTNKASEAIKNSSELTNTSVEKANQAGTSLQTITQSINTINEMNSLIAVNAQEQTMVTVAATENINKITTLSHQASADATVTSQSSEQLAQLANQLAELVEQFKLS